MSLSEISGVSGIVTSFDRLRAEVPPAIVSAARRLTESIPIINCPTDETTVGPLLVGNLYPDTVKINRNESSLMGALAVAISAVSHEESAELIFGQLSAAAKIDTAARLDSPRRITKTIDTVSHLKLPFLKKISVDPLLLRSGEDERDSVSRVIYALGHSAIIAPIIDKRRSGRVIWTAITGYKEAVDLTDTVSDLANETNTPEPTFITTAISPHRRGIDIVDKSKLHKLCDLNHAQLLSRVERLPKSS